MQGSEPVYLLKFMQGVRASIFFYNVCFFEIVEGQSLFIVKVLIMRGQSLSIIYVFYIFSVFMLIFYAEGQSLLN